MNLPHDDWIPMDHFPSEESRCGAGKALAIVVQRDDPPARFATTVYFTVWADKSLDP